MNTQTKKGNTAIVAVIIVIVAITAGLIGWLLARQSQMPAAAPQQAVAPQPAQTQNAVQPVESTLMQANQATKNNISDRQTYKNSNYNFSFQYPKSLQLSVDQADADRLQPLVESYGGSIISFDAPTKDPQWNQQGIYQYPELKVYLISKPKFAAMMSDCKNGKLAADPCLLSKTAENDKYIAWVSNYNQDAPNDAIKGDLLDQISASFKFSN